MIDFGENELNMTDKIMLVAEMYYVYGLTQGEIAKRLQVSRPWISKLLSRGVAQGIVRIEVMSHLAGYRELEQSLQKKYGTKFYIAKNSGISETFVNIGKAVANYLAANIRPGDTIGVSWGTTISVMSEQIPPMTTRNVRVVPLVGGIGAKAEYLSNMVAMKMAEAMGANCELLHAQAFCPNEDIKRTVLANPEVQSVLHLGNHADIALVCVGDIRQSTMALRGFISERNLEELIECGAVGDVALWFIDKYGKILDHERNRSTIACSLPEISENAREVICIASGAHKIRVLDAALKGGWFTSLFTDVDTAQMLFEYEN